MINEKREFDLLKAISFVRVGGSAQEEKAADIIIDALKEVGIEGRKESFEVNSSDNKEAYLEILEPYNEKITVTGYLCCKDTPDEGLEAELVYFEGDNEVSKKQVKGKIVLVNGYVGKITYKAFAKAGAIGFISFNGHIDYPLEHVDLDERELRTPDEGVELLPGVNMKITDAINLVEKKASKVRMFVKQNPKKVNSHNVVCDIEGEDNSETICFTAHYDSVPFSNGAYDNATGSVCLYEMAAYFKQHKPLRHLRFIWCGSEERGLLGSKAYCDSHKDDLEKTRFCINVDMIGTILGKRIAVATADNAVVNYIDYYCKINGFPLNARQGVYSSDSTPFADCGVPSMSFARVTPPGGGDIHNRFDIVEHLSSAFLAEDTEFITKFAESLVNAYVFPIKKEVPKNMQEDIDKYFGREKK